MTKRKKLLVSVLAGLAMAMKWLAGNYLYGLCAGAIGAVVAFALRQASVLVNPYGFVTIVLVGAALGLTIGPALWRRIRPHRPAESSPVVEKATAIEAALIPRPSTPKPTLPSLPPWAEEGGPLRHPGHPPENLEIEPEESQQWGENPAWVQHILVTNRGLRGRFRVSVTGDIYGLAQPYGKAHRLLWEQTNSDEMELGRGESGRLRFAQFEPTKNGPEVRFFAIPTSRHPAGSGYLPTQTYTITASELLFGLCVRNAETDETVERQARVIFGDRGRPRLTLFLEPTR